MVHIINFYNTYWVSEMKGEASVAIEEIGEERSVGIALSPHSDSFQHPSIAQLLDHEGIVTQKSFLLSVGLDTADKVR